MNRSLSLLAVAMVLSVAASGHALSEDFNTWQKNFGTTAGKAGRGATGANQTMPIGASQATTSKRKGVTDPKETITIHGSQNPAPGWPAKIDPGLGLKSSNPASSTRRGTQIIEGGGSLKQPCGMGHLGCLDGDPPSGKGFNPKK
jgi:hypothetical protein